MNIVVCVKRTPASTSVALDPQTGAVKTAGLPHGINPFDEYAVEEALRLKERIPGTKVAVLSVGPAENDEVIRAALALGCDTGVLLSDPAFAGSDVYALSLILAKGIQKVAETRGGVGLVLFGRQSNDGESGHTTAAVGARLGWPSVISVRKIPEAADAAVTVERLREDGTDVLQLTLPAVLSVLKEINEPRLPSLRGKMSAKKMPVETWGAAALGLSADVVGKAGSRMDVVKMAPVPSRGAGVVITGETPEDKAQALVAKLKEAKFI